MSCSSCVGKIAAALEQKPWFDGEQNAEELVKIIDSIGYEASLEHVDELPPAPGAGPRVVAGLWSASYAIGGTTCSSCVSTITKALETLPWTKSVDVNLITNSATVVLEDKSHPNEIAEIVESVGYNAKLSDVVDMGRGKAQDGSRTVSIRVNGMYSTVGNSIMTISYTPNSPEFTIMAILSTISAVDPAFNPIIYHPPIVEERAAQIHARIRQRIFYRVLLSVIVAIPAFITGIVFMSLVPPSNSGRRYLMEQL
ncbi:Heavy metal translocatin [Pleurostoma richardsiae]|uniref:Heavy metal translocatin n=1 Tax=Pleurostoma richardsiae TaxID=41990 RepID=A0AA38VH96_9PEZI|nr:Heavy metal translocatin [Pleurostoma richardsiae]